MMASNVIRSKKQMMIWNFGELKEKGMYNGILQ